MNNSKKNPLLKSLDTIDNILSKVEGVMLAIGIIAIAITTITSVISRFIFNDALTITDELNMIFIIIVTFAGLSYAARNGRHIRMSAIYDAMPTKTRKIIIIFISFITSMFMFLLAKYSFEYIIEVYKSGRILPAIGIPVFYVYLWVPIGFTVTGLQYFFTVIKNLSEKDVYLSTNIKDGYTSVKNSDEEER
ncbi:C4-dicarboxylate ABC transporter permease [Halarcobacter mediterraneus]|uniref:C4-dicarboxylate ABC transporter permease n=1 Tax=Halarcobacter mediterraneus TaxID=2023153 RepID=A0A4Q1ARI7_9BACT|nr:TRAP transporter small permease [Halarcobacter mediterraneus]RXK12135.1 C4-dicarboxylate ABC transporter permease [Halarcobacter mediterraneus]